MIGILSGVPSCSLITILGQTPDKNIRVYTGSLHLYQFTIPIATLQWICEHKSIASNLRFSDLNRSTPEIYLD